MNGDFSYHRPVMPQETIGFLAIRPQGTYLDGTMGGGGHFRLIGEKLSSKGTLIGVDRDPDAIKWTKEHPPATTARVIIEQIPFSQFTTIIDTFGIRGLDGILLDLGVSSHQISDPQRGFSYQKESPLDMRMDPASGQTAAELISGSDEKALADILSGLGDITNPMRMARALKRFDRQMLSSSDLKDALACEYGHALEPSVLAKIFQALRISVNGELKELSETLDAAEKYLNPGGRLVVIAYHSLEDRIVKQFMAAREKGCTCPPKLPICVCKKKPTFKRITHHVSRPTDEEVAHNPRSRSARLRTAERVEN